MSSLRLITPAAYYPLTLEEAKQHLRVDDTAEDDLILSLIIAATEYVEQASGRQLISAQYRHSVGPVIANPYPQYYSSYFQNPTDLSFLYPASNAYPLVKWYPSQTAYVVIPLPKAPVLSVDSVQYYDGNNTLQTLSSTNYRLANDLVNRASLILTNIPSVYEREDAIQVTFTSGWGNAEDVPESLRVAIRMLVGEWYRNREASVMGSINEVPYGVERLVGTWRLCEYR